MKKSSPASLGNGEFGCMMVLALGMAALFIHDWLELVYHAITGVP